MYQYSELKERHRTERDGYDQQLSLRLHRALSWLKKAEASADDLDACFIFQWIAFNSAYAYQVPLFQNQTEKDKFSQFFERIAGLDNQQKIYNLVWQEFSSSIRVLLDNRYIFQPFWQFQAGELDEKQWQEQFKKAKDAANKALSSKDTVACLEIIFNRLYTLRNQIMHGGATHNSGANRDQLRDAVAILSKLLPLVFSLMMDDGKSLWGSANYPVVDG